MQKIILLIIIGFSLSIDAFSISTIIGLSNIKKTKQIFMSVIVGIYHFIMPLLGYLLSNQLLCKININTNKLLGIILLLLSIESIINLLKQEEEIVKIDTKKIILLGFIVSIDSFFIGMGLKALNTNILIPPVIFSIISSSMTYIGLIIGKGINKYAKKYSDIIAILLLLILGITFLCK